MKYFKANDSEIAGPGDKPLHFSTDKEEISEAEFTKIIDDFIEGASADEVKKKETKEMIWTILKDGNFVTIENVTLTIEQESDTNEESFSSSAARLGFPPSHRP